MSPKVLRIGEGFSLPAEEFVEAKFGVIGQSGRGKTGLVRRTLEECHRVGLPFVVMDPSSILWGLRSSYDGKAPGLPVVVIGGDHGDVRLDRGAGAEVARSVVAANASCVVDLGSESKATYRTFAKDFAETLFAVNDAPRLLVLDEAPELVPQSLTGRPDLAVTYDAIERLVRQGRNKGIGVMLVSQRAATISKDVLTQCGSLFVFGLVGTPDRKALREWVSAYGGEDKVREFEDGLASLERRECWFWSPAEFRRFERFRVADFHTFHPDRTHLRRLGLLDAKPVTQDVSTVVARLGKQMERLAKERADTRRLPALEREVTRLKAEVERYSTGTARPPASSPSRREIEAPLRQQINVLQHDLRSANRRIGEARQVAERILQIDPIPTHEPTDRPTPHYPALPGTTRPEPARPAPVQVPDNGETHIKAGARRMLQEIASRHPLTLTYAQLATLAGFTPSGGTASTYFSTLRKAGYLAEDRDGNVTVTQQGMDYLGTDVPPAPTTHREVMDRWGRNLKAGTYKMLEVVAGRFPEPITRQELGEVSGFTVTGGTFSTYLGILRNNGLVEIAGDEVRATGVLFPEGT